MSYLKTARITLNLFSPDETHLLFELDSDPDVMKWLTDGKTSSMEESEAVMERILSLYARYDSKFGVYKANLNETGEYVGWFLFRPNKKTPENLKEVELGYRMKKKFWGQGFGTEVSKKLVQKAFNELNVETLFATAMLENLPSQHIMKKIGMTLEYHYQEDLFPGDDKRAVRLSMKHPLDS